MNTWIYYTFGRLQHRPGAPLLRCDKILVRLFGWGITKGEHVFPETWQRNETATRLAMECTARVVRPEAKIVIIRRKNK
jgi:hypothetical protein